MLSHIDTDIALAWGVSRLDEIIRHALAISNEGMEQKEERKQVCPGHTTTMWKICQDTELTIS